jgi:hypothetical protein
MTGQVGEKGLAMGAAFIPFAEAFADIARTHADENVRLFAAIQLGNLGVWESTVRHERWDW